MFAAISRVETFFVEGHVGRRDGDLEGDIGFFVTISHAALLFDTRHGHASVIPPTEARS